jgi:broad-specificity NMP kinase
LWTSTLATSSQSDGPPLTYLPAPRRALQRATTERRATGRFDLVVVLRCENDKLFPRLEARGYSSKKIEENVDAEIMCVVAEEARESYREDIIWELQSNTLEDMERNVARIATQLGQWGGVTPKL